MRKGIDNMLRVYCNDIDLTTLTDVEFYLRQGRFFRQYTPEVISRKEMVVRVPLEDANMLALTQPVQMQFAFTDARGNPMASEITGISVRELLKEAGYDPV